MIGQTILHYRHNIKQNLPFRLKRLHVWNVSGWTPTQIGLDPKLRLVRRLIHAGPVMLQETRWHDATPQAIHHSIPGIQIVDTPGQATERGGVSGGVAILIPPGWRLERFEEVIAGRAVLAVIQDRYSTLGLLSIYLHPTSKETELNQLTSWLKREQHNFPLYVGGDFNRADSCHPDKWDNLLIYGNLTDPAPALNTFEGPNGLSPLDRVLCPTEYLTAAQIDVVFNTHKRHVLSSHYQITARFLVRPSVRNIS